MRSRRRINAEERSTGWRWRQLGMLAWLGFVWVMLMWIAWGFPYTRAVHSGLRTRTSYGIFRWLDDTNGLTRIHSVPAAFTLLLCAAVTAFLVVYGRRTLGNLTPRWKCQHCGHDVSEGFPRSNVCSECGELPNLRRNPWAFWS